MSNNTQMMSRAEQNALSVSYDVFGTHVELDLQFVKNYLVRGDASKITDQEIVFFMNTCMMQKLNPLVAGEVYCIKFGQEPAQLVVGKGAYLRRAVENPNFLHKEDGITVVRGGEVIQKEGCCLYPGEELLGGWCRITYNKDGREQVAYKEVSLSEYNKGQANWKTKPATMINKVAISQCCREAFPRDFHGTYSEDEMVASGAIPVNYAVVDEGTGEVVEDPVISQEQRKALFKMAHDRFGQEEGNKVILNLLQKHNMNSTTGMTTSVYNQVIGDLMATIESLAKAEAASGQEPPAPEAPEQ